MPESAAEMHTMAYPISFGYAKRAYPWSVLADFIRIARAQYPQPV